ncbi:hypothetical protein BDZ45DRAFT_734592 [Acephala macrosclerotiorum]|nr:hypothetical protein BDZ45DRAFT_734592 [Acephala macrosclerotiorum]
MTPYPRKFICYPYGWQEYHDIFSSVKAAVQKDTIGGTLDRHRCQTPERDCLSRRRCLLTQHLLALDIPYIYGSTLKHMFMEATLAIFLVQAGEAKVDPKHIKGRLASIYLDAMFDVRAELKIFKKFVKAHGLDISGKVGHWTQVGSKFYLKISVIGQIGIEGKLEGLVLLWAAQHVYAEAWKYAASFADEGNDRDEDLDGGLLGFF